jgi:hypothetical protein
MFEASFVHNSSTELRWGLKKDNKQEKSNNSGDRGPRVNEAVYSRTPQ